MIIVFASHPVFDMKAFVKAVAIKFAMNFIEVDKESLHKNKGLFHNPPTNNAIYEGVVLANKFGEKSINIYLKWSKESLIKQVMAEGRTFEQATEIVEDSEKKESEYVKKFFGIDTKDIGFYDLVISADRLDSEGLISVIEKYVNKIKK